MSALSPLFQGEFYHDGRGPELKRVHWSSGGRCLAAIDYLNPDHGGAEDLRHVRFNGVQVVMVTPEEVMRLGHWAEGVARLRPAAMFDFDRSAWMAQFEQCHLGNCRHVGLMFYDEYFDVICEGVSCHVGGFSG